MRVAGSALLPQEIMGGFKPRPPHGAGLNQLLLDVDLPDRNRILRSVAKRLTPRQDAARTYATDVDVVKRPNSVSGGRICSVSEVAKR